ncbi:MAG: glycosyltransferase family 4 protein [Clostridia bacterium]|nr:glycosyltransferase family 4 protein [Clostridia bacterium]
MKILTVITGMCTGGAERVMATLCNEFSKNNEVILLCLRSAETDYAIDPRVRIIDGKVTGKNFFKAVKVTRKVIKEEKPDVAMSFMNKSNLVLLEALRGLRDKVPAVVCERANPGRAWKSIKILRKLLYPRADGAVFQTPQAQAYYKDILKCDSVVLKNPLSPDFKAERYEGERRRVIVTAGRLSSEKNHRLLIDAFSDIAGEFPDMKLEIYGNGPLTDELQTAIDETGLSDRITLMGRKDNVQNYTRDAELFVLPSDSEGMPNALLEAMALGIASISTDCPIGGPGLIIRHGENGLLVPVGDREAMAEAMRRMLTDDGLAARCRENAPHVSEDYAAESVCRDWEKYLIEVSHEE